LLDGLDRFRQRAYGILTSFKTREAFDLSREPTASAERFGKHTFGQSCLLAGRLVAAGVRFATVSFGGWDTHAQNFARLKGGNGAGKAGKGAPGLLPQLDDGLAALLDWLHQRGLLETTVVFVTGEFGRTPKINPAAGRDHWA